MLTPPAQFATWTREADEAGFVRNAELVDRLGLRDYIIERFGIAGNPDEVVDRIRTLHERGIDNFWMSMHAGDKGRVVRLMRDHVMPQFT